MGRLTAALLLAIALGGIALFLRGDRGRWRRFVALTDTDERQRQFRHWAARLWLCFALPALAGLAVLGRLDALMTMPDEFGPVAVLLPRFTAPSRDLLEGLGGGIVVGVTIVVIVFRLRGGRGFGQVGEVAAIQPRNRAELWLAAWLSVSAGVTEEVGFRLFLPLLVAIVTGSALIAVAAAIAIFGALHLYQGRAGVIAATIVGAVLTFVYLASGTLWLAMMLHALVDLAGLVLRPALRGAWRR